MMCNKRRVELPLLEPMYSTFHYQGTATSILVNNPSIRNWYLNNIMELKCDRSFLSGFTTPSLTIYQSDFSSNPHIEKLWFAMHYLNGCLNKFIRNMIDAGFYIAFNGIDDYYIPGKSWYHTSHFNHDGLICGYDQNNKTFCMYAYDNNWVYRKFWTPQSAFSKSYKIMYDQGVRGSILAIRPKADIISFEKDTALNNIKKYLDSDMDKYPENVEGEVYGIAVHNYICKYIDKLYDGSIPYSKMDRRIFRLIWEHKNVMLERIEMIEKELQIDNLISSEYSKIVSDANMIRMLYASHHIKRRDGILPTIREKLYTIMDTERKLLNDLILKSEEKHNAMEIY